MSHHFRQPSPAPGQAAPGAATTSQEAQPPAKDPGAAGGGGGGPLGGQWMLLVMFLPIVLILLMSRNQNKKQKQLEESLNVGDKVVTQSGLIGRITDKNEQIYKIEIAPGVKVEVLKSAVQAKFAPAEQKTDKTDAKDAKEEKKA